VTSEVLVMPEAGSVDSSRLGHFVSARAPSESDDPELRRAYLAALARHQDIKRELIPLIKAWRAAGIETLLFKGFFLSEFVYPVPGMRFHGDVDLLVRPEQGAAALRIAQGLGWTRPWMPRHLGDPDAAFLAYLHRPEGVALLDVHQLLAPASRWWSRRQRWITDAVWTASVAQEWEGTVVHLPSMADAIVVNLALERATVDRGVGFKSHDPVDLHHLMARGPATLEEARRRARELGCRRTLEGFLRLCRPSAEPVPAVTLPVRARLEWMTPAFWESGYLHVPPPLLRAVRAPALAWGIARVLPLLFGVRRVLRRHRDVREVLAHLTPPKAPAARSSASTRRRTVRGIYWAVRLLPLGSETGRCLQRSLAVYAALRRQGWPVTFVSGVRRSPTGLEGHAWVEEDGLVLAELAGRERIWEYRANFRYPPSS
jgi:hypothetical protein